MLKIGGSEFRTTPTPGQVSCLTVRPSLRVNASWVLAARIVYNICQFGILAALARLGSTETVGQFVLGLAVTAPIVIFFGLQLQLALATDTRGDYALVDYLRLRNVTSVLTLALIGVAAVGLRSLQDAAAIIFAVGLSKVVETFSDVHYGHLQKCEAVPLVARSLMIRGPAALLAVALTYLLTENLTAACLAMAGAWLAVLLLHDIPASRAAEDPQRVRPDRGQSALRHLISLFRKVLPLGLAAGLCSLEANVPRYVVGAMFGSSELGVFGAIVYLMVVGQTVVTAIAYSTIARLSDLYSTGQLRVFQALLMKMIAVTVVLGVGLASTMGIGGHHILNLLYGVEYAREYGLLVLVSLAAAVQLNNGILMTAVEATRKFKTILVLRIVSLATTAVLSATFTRLYGLNGVGWGLLLAAMLQTSVVSCLLWRWLGATTVGAASTTAGSELASEPRAA